ncbi:uncharacterized protein LOC100185987 [Ciona intestinalis]
MNSMIRVFLFLVLVCREQVIVTGQDVYDNELESSSGFSGYSGEGSGGAKNDDFFTSGDSCSGSGDDEEIYSGDVMSGENDTFDENFDAKAENFPGLDKGISSNALSVLQGLMNGGGFAEEVETDLELLDVFEDASGANGLCINGDICFNGGTCETLLEESRCLCAVGYTGHDCSSLFGDTTACLDCQDFSGDSLRKRRSLENYHVVQVEWRHNGNFTGTEILAEQLISGMLDEKRHHNIALATLGGFILLLAALFVGYFLARFGARVNRHEETQDTHNV